MPSRRFDFTALLSTTDSIYITVYYKKRKGFKFLNVKLANTSESRDSQSSTQRIRHASHPSNKENKKIVGG